jgi:hypothetical protein
MTQPFDETTGWSALAADWQKCDEQMAADPLSLRVKVQRETTIMRRGLIVEVAFSLAVVAMTVWSLVSDHGPRTLLIAVDSWVVIAIVWAFALSGRRGLWAPSAESTEAYLVLSRRRAELRLRTAWFALVLVVAQLLVARAASVPSSPVQWIVSAGWIAWAFWIRQQAIRECRWLDGLLAEYSPKL